MVCQPVSAHLLRQRKQKVVVVVVLRAEELERLPDQFAVLFDVFGLGLQLLRRSEEHTSELQSLMRISYAVFCLKKKNKRNTEKNTRHKDKPDIQSDRHT